MPAFACIECGRRLHVSVQDLAIPVLPRPFNCGNCGTSNMLSRRSLLMALAPSLVLGATAGVSNALWLGLSPGYVVMLGGYWIGVAVGVALCSHYGSLSAPHGWFK